MTLDRTTIIQGPAQVIFGGQTFWSKGNVVLKPNFSRFSIETSHKGKVDERFSDRLFEVTFEPSGRRSAGIDPILLGAGALSAGNSLFGSTDTPLVIHGRDGIKITLHNAAITKYPTARIGVTKTLFGPVTFTALLAKNTDPTNAAAYYTIASAAYPGDAGFSVADITTRQATAAWGETAPWDAFLSEDGFVFDFAIQTTPVIVDGLGTIDMIFQNLDVSVKAAVVGITMADAIAALKPTQALGTSLAGDALVVTNGDLDVTLNAAALVSVDEIRWGQSDKRIAQCEWMACEHASGKYETAASA